MEQAQFFAQLIGTMVDPIQLITIAFLLIATKSLKVPKVIAIISSGMIATIAMEALVANAPYTRYEFGDFLGQRLLGALLVSFILYHLVNILFPSKDTKDLNSQNLKEISEKKIDEDKQSDANLDETKINIRENNQEGLVQAQNDALPETKACPFCAEEIKFAAVKCRYCHEMLTN